MHVYKSSVVHGGRANVGQKTRSMCIEHDGHQIAIGGVLRGQVRIEMETEDIESCG